MNRYIKLYTICLALITALAGCAEIVVREVNYAATLHIPNDAHPAPIKFSNLRILLPPGTDIGMESGMGPAIFGGYCSGQQYPVNRRILSQKFEKEWLEAAFEEALESQGYDVTNQIDMDYEYESELARAEYSISAKVIDVDLDLCKRSPGLFTIFNSAPRAKGKMNVTYEWSVYDALKRTTVYTLRTQGYSRRDHPNQEALELLFMDTFDMAAHNLGADQGFYDLIVNGIKPSRKSHKNKPPRPLPYDHNEKIAIKNTPLLQSSFTHIAENKRKVAITVQKSGHGSGFFITDKGHILTNAHVVGHSDFVRIVLADKKQALTAQVLRTDKARDVAVLKLIEMPENYQITLLPIRIQTPAVSSDIFAIGTPKHQDQLENTISKGIISNARREINFGGTRLNFIQGDIDIHGGNSGGPLLDDHGNIIGISASGLYMDASKISSGLNLFIPINEALQALDITIQ